MRLRTREIVRPRTGSTDQPRPAASRAIPQPFTPPPITARSTSSCAAGCGMVRTACPLPALWCCPARIHRNPKRMRTLPSDQDRTLETNISLLLRRSARLHHLQPMLHAQRPPPPPIGKPIGHQHVHIGEMRDPHRRCRALEFAAVRYQHDPARALRMIARDTWTSRLSKSSKRPIRRRPPRCR